MSDKHNPSFFKNFFAAVFTGFFIYLVFPVISNIVSAYVNQDARYDPQRSQSPATPTNSSTKAARLPTPNEAIQTPSPTPTQTLKPEPKIAGEWKGT